MKIFKRAMLCIFLLFLWLSALPVNSQAADNSCGPDATWKLENGVLTISGTGEITECPWRKSNNRIKSAVIEPGITSIAPWAFYDCNQLSSVSLPEGLTKIGAYAFASCDALTSIVLPHSLESIDSFAFQHSDLKQITIPEKVTVIEDYVFSDCHFLTSVTLSPDTTSIDNCAFQNCTKLASITLPETLTTINPMAFQGCTALTSITIPSSVRRIEQAAFADCVNIKAVYTSDLSAWLSTFFVTGTSNPLAYGADLYVNGELLTDLVLPAETEGKGNRPLYGCASLRSVTFLEGYEYIDVLSFYGCANLSTISLPSSIHSIGIGAFKNCTNLTQVIYAGSYRQKDQIRIGIENTELRNAEWKLEPLAHLMAILDMYMQMMVASAPGIIITQLPVVIVCGILLYRQKKYPYL